MPDIDPWMALASLALGVVSMLTRGLFFLSNRPWHLPLWAERGLQYAPVAALAAVVAPDLFMTQGHWVASWKNARLYAALVSVGWVFWRGGVLGAIVSGMAVYLPLHLGLGW